MTDSDWLRVTEEGDTLHLEWDNRQAPRDHVRAGCSAVVMLVFVAVGLGAGCVAAGVVGPEPWYMRVLAAAGAGLALLLALVIGYKLLARRWTEWLDVSPAGITHGARGRLAGRPYVYPVGPKSEWTFGRDADDDRDTLRAGWVTGWGSRQAEVGEWLSGRARERVFLVVARFAQARQISLSTKRVSWTWGGLAAELVVAPVLRRQDDAGEQ